MTAPGTVEPWGRDPGNLEALGLADLAHEKRNNSVRAR